MKGDNENSTAPKWHGPVPHFTGDIEEQIFDIYMLFFHKKKMMVSKFFFSLCNLKVQTNVSNFTSEKEVLKIETEQATQT